MNNSFSQGTDMIKTVSLELAKELKEAGFPQETDLFWASTGVCPSGHVIPKERVPVYQIEFSAIAAPTAEEILGRLPPVIKFMEKTDVSTIGWKRLYMWMGGDQFDNVRSFHIGFNDRPETAIKEINLAEAAGRMYLYLKEQDLLHEGKKNVKK
jgi:hypothetical protein